MNLTSKNHPPKARSVAKRLLPVGTKTRQTVNMGKQHKAGFTLVEIMIVVAIIAVLVSISTSGFIRARKHSQATRVLDDLRLLDAALDQYAMETGRITGFNPTFDDLKRYLKPDQSLYVSGKDIMGNDYGPFTVDKLPNVPANTFNAFSDVLDADFWSPYQ